MEEKNVIFARLVINGGAGEVKYNHGSDPDPARDRQRHIKERAPIIANPLHWILLIEGDVRVRVYR